MARGQQIDGLADRNPHDAMLAIHPAVTRQYLALGRALRSALTARPDLCSLMTTADRGVVIGYVVQLIPVLARHGFSHDDAVGACGILVHVTLSMTLADMAAPGQWDDPEVFDTTIRWLINGMEAEAHGETRG